jgi:predicted acyl esterase
MALQTPLAAQDPAQDVQRVKERYTKYEYQIPMRDGARLYAAVYVPKDTSQKYPFLLTRTPYSIAPYGVDNYRAPLGPSEQFERDGFIFVYEDARGRNMSERDFLQVRPYQPNKKSSKDIDGTDTYGTIEWLLKNIPNNAAKSE